MKKSALVLLALSFLVKVTLILFVLVLITGKDALAQGQILDQLKERRIIDSVRFDERIGLYEVRAGSETFYMSKDFKYVFVGVVLDTEELLKRQAQNSFKKIPDEHLKKAIKVGNGKKVVIEFTDPDCPFCRKSHKFFEGKNVTRYVFFYPLTKLHPHADEKVIHILCSDDKEKAYKEVYSGKYDKDRSKLKKCDEGANLLKQHIQIASQHGIRATPYFIIDNVPVIGANLQLIDELLREGK